MSIRRALVTRGLPVWTAFCLAWVTACGEAASGRADEGGTGGAVGAGGTPHGSSSGGAGDGGAGATNGDCNGGECPECPAGQAACGDGCVDTQSDIGHCGGCNQPCDGVCDGGVCQPVDRCPSIDEPDVHVSVEDGTWTIEGLGGATETRASLKAALDRAFARLTPGRTTKQSVVVEGSGRIGSNERIELPSYTILDVCGTIHVTSSGGSGDQAPIYARNRRDIEIRHASITGTPLYAMFFRQVSHLHLGKIDIRLDGSGFGIRLDNDPSNNGWGRTNRVTDIHIDDVYVEGTSNHGVETYGVDGLTIGQVVARNVGYAGLLLNATINAEVGRVDGEDVGTGTGYATFRIANEAGKEGATWPAGNIHVGEVRARRGGRGIFCVSDSGGLTVDNVDIADTGNNSILLENCHQTRIGAEGGTVSGGGELRIAHRTDEHTPSSNVTVQNLQVTGTTVRESPCGTNIRICNISGGPNIQACAGTVSSACP